VTGREWRGVSPAKLVLETACDVTHRSGSARRDDLIDRQDKHEVISDCHMTTISTFEQSMVMYRLRATHQSITHESGRKRNEGDSLYYSCDGFPRYGSPLRLRWHP
jgi:hypothetical protein